MIIYIKCVDPGDDGAGRGFTEWSPNHTTQICLFFRDFKKHSHVFYLVLFIIK